MSAGQGTPSRPRDRGETLIELLTTITIMGIGLTAILGAVGMGISGSSRVRSDSTLVAAMRSYGEALSNLTDGQYSPCAQTTAYSPSVELPPSTTVTVTKVEVWDGTAYQLADTDTTNPVVGCTDRGLQRITLAGTDSRVTPSVTGTLVVFVRKPCTSNANPC